jgi:hypothetical protein
LELKRLLRLKRLSVLPSALDYRSRAEMPVFVPGAETPLLPKFIELLAKGASLSERRRIDGDCPNGGKPGPE